MYKGTGVVHEYRSSTSVEMYRSITGVQVYISRSIMQWYKYCTRAHSYRSSIEVHCVQE
jgi:hypothetical protein